jgi:hypothetical protein
MYNERIPCRFCAGSGRDWRGPDCAYCGGSGTVNGGVGPGLINRRRLRRRQANRDQLNQATTDERVASRSGAWYADPYGSLDRQRWWDGTKWTNEVRAARGADPPAVRVAGTAQAQGAFDQTEAPRREQPGTNFPLRLRALVGQPLWLRATGEKHTECYELLTEDRLRVARVTLGGVHELAHLECAEGAWRVDKQRPWGWELTIEHTDGRPAGWYSGRRWRAGGTLSLTTGARLDLRRPLPGLWKLRTTDTRELIADMRGYGPGSTRLTIRSLPLGVTDDHVAILTACAVGMLERTLRVPVSNAGG